MKQMKVFQLVLKINAPLKSALPKNFKTVINTSR